MIKYFCIINVFLLLLGCKQEVQEEKQDTEETIKEFVNTMHSSDSMRLSIRTAEIEEWRVMLVYVRYMSNIALNLDGCAVYLFDLSDEKNKYFKLFDYTVGDTKGRIMGIGTNISFETYISKLSHCKFCFKSINNNEVKKGFKRFIYYYDMFVNWVDGDSYSHEDYEKLNVNFYRELDSFYFLYENFNEIDQLINSKKNQFDSLPNPNQNLENNDCYIDVLIMLRRGLKIANDDYFVYPKNGISSFYLINVEYDSTLQAYFPIVMRFDDEFHFRCAY